MVTTMLVTLCLMAELVASRCKMQAVTANPLSDPFSFMSQKKELGTLNMDHSFSTVEICINLFIVHLSFTLGFAFGVRISRIF